ncbi:MAG: hypothetical protein HYW27_03265 [Candidatus Aenigmarchaeota archaeon]|nr:hypothetical protein [Candidatus Aenigmarchaeota archaeon]
MGNKIAQFLAKHWAPICLLLIIFLAFYVRIDGYRWQYLRNIDSYTFARFMDEIVENGGALPQTDNLVRTPLGMIRSFDVHPYEYLGAYTFMSVRLFYQNIQIWQFLVYFPAFLAALIAIPMYFIGKALYDRKAGLLMAFFTVFDASLVARTLGGDPDNDAFVLLVPMVLMAVFIYSYKYIEKERKFDKKFFAYTFLLAALFSLWSVTWIGYWYVFWMVSGFIFLKFMLYLIQSRSIKTSFKNIRHILASYMIYVLIAFIFIANVYSVGRVLYTFRGPFEFQNIKGEEKIIFPNVYVSVAELQQSGGPKEIIERTSTVQGIGILLSPFFLMIYCLMYLFYSYVKKRQHFDTLLLLFIWFAGPFIATTIAVRFAILFTAPMAIGSGILLSKIIRMATGEDKKIED